MGRNKIKIQYIKEDRIRNITFNKRKNGLLKKACELAILCNIKIVLSFTDLNGNVYNYMAPDGSAPESIKRSLTDHNVYNMVTDDYPVFSKNKHVIDKSESFESLQSEIQEKRIVQQETLNKKRKLNLKIQIPDSDNREQIANDFDLRDQHNKIFEQILPNDNVSLEDKKNLDILDHISSGQFQIPPQQQANFNQNFHQVQTSFGVPQTNPPRVFLLVDINSQFQTNPGASPNYYQNNLGYSNLSSAQSNMSYYIQKGNNHSQIIYVIQTRPAQTFQFENDLQQQYLLKQIPEEALQQINIKQDDKLITYQRMQSEQNKRPTDL